MIVVIVVIAVIVVVVMVVGVVGSTGPPWIPGAAFINRSMFSFAKVRSGTVLSVHAVNS